jgi:predicted protein tyrosine phosphatase
MMIWAVDAATAAEHLDDAEYELSAMLSIRSIDDPPITSEDPPRVPLCELRFRDVSRDLPDGPSQEVVARGIEWLREHVGEPGRLLIHCEMGISRSVAFAAIALYLQGTPENRVFYKLPEHVAHGSPSPNADVLAIADELLGSSLVRFYKRDMSGNYRMWSLCNS